MGPTDVSDVSDVSEAEVRAGVQAYLDVSEPTHRFVKSFGWGRDECGSCGLSWFNATHRVEDEAITYDGLPADGIGVPAAEVDEFLRERRPTIVVLCGSTRFPEAWTKARYDLTLAGEIVLTIGCDTKSDEGLGITAEQKVALDELHKRKIDLADRVLVLNVGGYIGESTRSEITYAKAHHKPIDYLETP